MLVQWWSTVSDAGTTLSQHWSKVLCLLCIVSCQGCNIIVSLLHLLCLLPIFKLVIDQSFKSPIFASSFVLFKWPGTCFQILVIERRHLLLGAVISTVLLFYQNIYATLVYTYKTTVQIDDGVLSVREVETNSFNPKPLVKVLMWAPFSCRRLMNISNPSYVTSRECDNSLCQFTANRSEWQDNQAVLFDIRNTNAMFKDGKPLIPPHHPHQQYWLLYNEEAMFQHPSYYSLLDSGGYNITASYRHDANIHLPYGQCGPRKHGHYKLPPGFPNNKTGLVVWHVSHCNDRSGRIAYVQKLSKYIRVDKVGKCFGNMLEDDERPRFTDNLSTAAEENINKYKFYLSFENTFCKEYMTEKVFKILQDNIYTVPVVRGSGPYENILPPGSYINADDFSTETDLALYLQKLDENDDLYMEYFKSRSDYQCINHSTRENPFLCRICDSISQMINIGFTNRLDKTSLRNQFDPEINCFSHDDNTSRRKSLKRLTAHSVLV